jgi:hypothetical protein
MANSCWDQLPIGVALKLTISRCAGVQVVDEHHAVPHEDFVLDCHAFADKGVALDLAPRANHGILLDLDERSEPGVVADLAAIEVNERVQADVFAQPDVRRDPNEVGRIRSFVSRRTHC